MSTVRLKRLQADYASVRDYIHRHPRLQMIQVEGEPPERYQLEYRIDSVRQIDSEVKSVKSHMVEIALPRNYPRTPPQCRMLTPVFHPNIAPHAICVGDHWSAGEPLHSIVARIGEIIAYQSYNTKSPLNGEAARWVDENRDRFPLDPVSMLVDENSSSPPPRAAAPAANNTATNNIAPPAAAPPATAPDPNKLPVECPQCSSQYLVKSEMAGKRMRCKNCQTVMDIPAPVSTRAPTVNHVAPPAAPAPTPKPPVQNNSTPDAATMSISCPDCDARYRVKGELAGKRLRCKKCQTIIDIPQTSTGL